jgi:hypothetical protein
MYAILCTRLDLAYPIRVVSQTHGQSKLRIVDYGQAHFSILARHLAIQITIGRITTPRDGQIL